MESVTNRGPLDQLVNELGIEELRGFLEDFLLRVDGDDSGSLWTKTLHENFAEALWVARTQHDGRNAMVFAFQAQTRLQFLLCKADSKVRSLMVLKQEFWLAAYQVAMAHDKE